MTVNIILSLLALFVVLDGILIVLILLQKLRHTKRNEKVVKARHYILDLYNGKGPQRPKLSSRFMIDAFIDAEEQVVFDEPFRKRVIMDLLPKKVQKKYLKQLNAFSVMKRQRAVSIVALIHETFAVQALFKRFEKEKREALKLDIAKVLMHRLDDTIFSRLMNSVTHHSENYQNRMAVLMGNAYNQVEAHLKTYFNHPSYEVNRVIVKFASFHTNMEYALYLDSLLAKIEDEAVFDTFQRNQLTNEILESLLDHHPEILMDTWHLNEASYTVRKYAILALAKSPKKTSMFTLVDSLGQGPLDDVRIQAISRMIYDYKEWLNDLVDKFFEVEAYKKVKLIKVLSHRIDYILLKLDTLKSEKLTVILKYMLDENLGEPLLDFLNKNENLKLENKIIGVIQGYLSEYPQIQNDFAYYAKPRVLKKLNLQSAKHVQKPKEKQPLEIKKIRWIVFWVSVNILVFPIVFLIEYWPLNDLDFIRILGLYALEINKLLIYYFMIINSIYIVLLILALIHSKRQVNQYKNRKYSELFKRKMLPGISIIAPAYNEELSIIDSVTSLLNLKYPQYEVVVVNDGSKDKTLDTLIEYFQLERKHPFFKTPLSTKPLRGVYVSGDVPNLIVIDKVNGGKADALNMGVNVSKYPLVCGIDADSVLEDDALLKIASKTLETTKPFLALGGNIYPANGFTFKNGNVTSKGLSKNHVARFQTIEYLRAFTSGRIGWSALRSLMIVSGAFGVFKKTDLIDSGGYLTTSSVHKKDTVGEDMELVVRLTRRAMQAKKEFRVMYVYNALCYTELPSDLKTLLKQRNRWQRGLVDILSYHRKLLFRPKYKQIGFIGYPYFFLFEFMGPFFEAQGYLMLLIALILGLLTPTIVLGIFAASIGFGVVVSLASLLMIEKETFMLSNKETMILILYAILENFGYRQLISLHRVKSTFSAIKESGQWGAQKRVGFNTKKSI